ncbi:MAG: hypothetical protein CML02_16295 [Pseudooceanicola sp.]|nr:hypothetical protein [Pseudooceanicola sp.]
MYVGAFAGRDGMHGRARRGSGARLACLPLARNAPGAGSQGFYALIVAPTAWRGLGRRAEHAMEHGLK